MEFGERGLITRVAGSIVQLERGGRAAWANPLPVEKWSLDCEISKAR